MTGVHIGNFDIDWLVDCLEVGEAIIEDAAGIIEQTPPAKVETFVLNRKAYGAAEGYLEARFQLYRTVYYHKTTRSAEAMLSVFLKRLILLLAENEPAELGLHDDDVVVQFLAADEPSLDQYLALDDIAMTGLLVQAATSSSDSLLKELGDRIIKRKLFKVAVMDHRDLKSDWTLKFEYRLRNAAGQNGREFGVDIVPDKPRLSGYDWVDFGDAGSLKKILIRGREQGENIDIGQDSQIIQALRKQDFYRVYTREQADMELVRAVERGG